MSETLFPPITEMDVFFFDGEGYEAYSLGDRHHVLPRRMRYNNMRGHITAFIFDYDPEKNLLEYQYAQYNHAGFPVKKFPRLPGDIVCALFDRYDVSVHGGKPAQRSVRQTR